MQREIFVSLALSYLGFPAVNYRGKSNGNTPAGFDCSGFVNFLLKEAKYPHHIPRHANELFDSFGILIHKQFRHAGDLVFFSNRGGTYPDHVGIMISENEYIHSPGKNGKVICVGRFEQKIIKPKNKAMQIYFSNPIGLKRITVNNGRYQQIFFRD
jgi:cell wall-associated NlpC family hydrolase